jgi:hypothetical protein
MASAYRGDTFRAMALRRILTWALIGAAATAQASPRGDPTTGRAVFTGAATPHPTSIGLDPAALGLGPANQLYVALTGVLDQLHIQLDNIGIDGNRSPGPRVSDIEPSPGGVIAFIYHLAGDQITLGFEARTNPRESFPANQQALRYHTLGDGERDWLASVGASFKLTGDLFVGASLSHQNTFLRLRYARDLALEGGRADVLANGFGNPDAAEVYDVNVRSRALSTSNLRVNIGVAYQLARDMWLAVGYHTPPGFAVQTELTGHVDIVRAPRDVARDGVDRLHGGAVVEIQFPASVDAELRARLPHQLDLHVAGRWEDLSRLRSYDVRTIGTTLRPNNIPEWTERPRGLHDSFAVWAGVEQVDSGGLPQVLFGARVGFETSAVTEARTSPITIAPASVTLDLGAQRRIARGVIVQLSYGLQYFPTVKVGASAFDPTDRLTCDDSGNDYATPACAAVRGGYAIAPGAGSYDRIEHALRLGLRYELP